MVASLVFLQNIHQYFSEVGVYVSDLSYLLFFCVLLHFASSINRSLIKGLFPQLMHPKRSSVNVCTCYLKINHVALTIVVNFSRQRSFALLLLSENPCDSFKYLHIFCPSILSATCISRHLISNVCSFLLVFFLMQQ